MFFIVWILNKGSRTFLVDFDSWSNFIIWEIVVPGVLIKSVNERDLLKLTVFEI